MVRIGIVGVGFMGMIHYLAAAKLRGARVTAICTRDAKKRGGDWRGIRGNFGPAGTWMDLGKIKRYAHFDELCDDADIDLIDICTPTHLHPGMARAALRRQTRPRRESHRPDAQGRRCHAASGGQSRQTAHGRACAAV